VLGFEFFGTTAAGDGSGSLFGPSRTLDHGFTVRWCDPGSIESIRVIRATRPNQGQPGAAENVKNQSRPALLLSCVPHPATITCLT